MRAIDADALKDYIDAQGGRPFIGCTVGQALKIMTDEQPTIQPDITYIVLETLHECGIYGEEATIKLTGTLKRIGRDDLIPPCAR